MSEFAGNYERTEKKKGWVVETEKRAAGAEIWVKDYFLSGPDDREDYGADLVLNKDFATIAEAVKLGDGVKAVRVEYRKGVAREAVIQLRSGAEIKLMGEALGELMGL